MYAFAYLPLPSSYLPLYASVRLFRDIHKTHARKEAVGRDAPGIAAAHSAPRAGTGSSNLYVLLYIIPGTPKYVSSYYYVCVLILATATARSATRAGTSK